MFDESVTISYSIIFFGIICKQMNCLNILLLFAIYQDVTVVKIH